jgi:predicted transcriptional regulator
MSIRLSAQERQAIEALAAKLDIPPSHMARHFLLQVVAFQNKRLQEKSEVK